MSNEPRLSRFSIAILAITGMIAVSSAGAMASLLLIDGGIGAVRSPAAEQRVAWHRGDVAMAPVSGFQVVQDLDDQADAGDLGGLDLTGFPDAMAAIEIAFPLLTTWVVVAAAQRSADSGAGRGL